MTTIKAFIFRDVKNENESSKPAIEIRLAVLGIMGYFLCMAADELWNKNYQMLLITVPCLFLYGAVFFADLYGAGDAGGVWAEFFDGFMDYHLRLLFWVGSGRAAVFIFADPDRFFPALLVP